MRNPHRPTHATGGSSSGCGALVGAGEVDLALGTDQGGSVRMPASWCGIYGLKPSYGLIPYTGIMNIDSAIDHAGPMTSNVTDNAIMLEVLAGHDGLDPRQHDIRTHRYTDALTGECRGMRIGVVTEGFSTPGAEADVDEAVRTAAASFLELGAEVTDVSIPWHAEAHVAYTPILIEGPLQQMLFTNGIGANGQGFYNSGFVERMHRWEDRAEELSEAHKVITVAGNLMRRRYGGRQYAKAMNVVRSLRAAYDDALENFDLLLMPTMPMKAQPLPPADASRELSFQRSLGLFGNTAPFNFTEHPAMTAPCAMRDGLPVGMMLIGKRFDEPSIYRAAFAFEQAADWQLR